VSPAVKRGLQVAKDLLRQKCLDMPFGSRFPSRFDIDEAIRWIAHQEAIDEKRRKPRKVIP